MISLPLSICAQVKIEMKKTRPSTAYIYLNKNFYLKYKNKLLGLIENSAIELFEKPNGYLAGEETPILSPTEARRPEPRTQPPPPTPPTP